MTNDGLSSRGLWSAPLHRLVRETSVASASTRYGRDQWQLTHDLAVTRSRHFYRDGDDRESTHTKQFDALLSAAARQVRETAKDPAVPNWTIGSEKSPYATPRSWKPVPILCSKSDSTERTTEEERSQNQASFMLLVPREPPVTSELRCKLWSKQETVSTTGCSDAIR